MDINISEEAEQLLDEMGEAKIKRYMMSFFKVKTKDKESSDFFF